MLCVCFVWSAPFPVVIAANDGPPFLLRNLGLYLRNLSNKVYKLEDMRLCFMPKDWEPGSGLNPTSARFILTFAEGSKVRSAGHLGQPPSPKLPLDVNPFGALHPPD